MSCQIPSDSSSAVVGQRPASSPKCDGESARKTSLPCSESSIATGATTVAGLAFSTTADIAGALEFGVILTKGAFRTRTPPRVAARITPPTPIKLSDAAAGPWARADTPLGRSERGADTTPLAVGLVIKGVLTNESPHALDGTTFQIPSPQRVGA